LSSAHLGKTVSLSELECNQYCTEKSLAWILGIPILAVPFSFTFDWACKSHLEPRNFIDPKCLCMLLLQRLSFPLHDGLHVVLSESGVIQLIQYSLHGLFFTQAEKCRTDSI
jgi:hypothetical protein